MGIIFIEKNLFTQLNVVSLVTSQNSFSLNFYVFVSLFRYAVGNFMCDYTQCTPKRDNRSCGSILSRVVGDLLTKAGYVY